MKTSIFFFLFMLCFSEINAMDSMWYHPNPWWKVARGNTTVAKNAFPYRKVFPQYGYPPRWTGEGWNISDWLKWTEHNKISAPHRLAGHSWQVFIQQNAELLKKNPQFLAEIKGKRLGYGKTLKFCVSNKQLQQAFVQNALTRFVKQADFTGYISVEPSDGAGHCECSECKKMGSISNRVFYLANLCAKAISEKFPKGGVNLYAYYQHVDTPSIHLEPNVHVTVIPSGFQDLYDGDALLYIWKKKTNNLTYYDYFSIPSFKAELPRIHISNFIRRINIVKKLQYKGFWHEVGLNLPSTIALQLVSQLWRDPSLTWDIVYSHFIEDCFPNAKIPMKRLFDRWFNDWRGDEEVILAYQDIREAEAMSLSHAEKKRLADIKAYTFYIAAYQEWQRDNTPIATQLFFDKVLAIAALQVVNTNALFQLFANKIKDPAMKKKYNFFVNKNWQWINSWSDKQIDDNLTKYHELTQKIVANSQKAAKPKALNNEKQLSLKYWNTVILKGTGEEIDLSIRSIDYAVSKDGLQYISIISNAGDMILSGLFPLEKKIRFPSKKNITYRVSIKQIFNSFLTVHSNGVKAVIE